MNEKQLMNNLNKGINREHDLFKKREAEMWNASGESNKLEDILKSRKKHELDEIRKAYRFRGISSLNKKDLAEELANLIPQHFVSTLHVLDQKRYQFVKQMAKHSGHVDGSDSTYKDITALIKNALAFPTTRDGERVLVLPEELLNVFEDVDTKQLKDRVDKNTQWIQLTEGMLFYYGYMTSNDLIESIEKFTNEEIDAFHYFQVIQVFRDFELRIQSNLDGFAHLEVEDVQKLKAEQNARKELSYYSFSKKELLKVGASDEVGPSQSMKPFMQLVKDYYDIEDEELQDIAALYESFIKEGIEMNELLEMFQKEFEVPTFEFLQKLGDTFVYANNNTRLWLLKGHTPSELSGHRQPTEEKQSTDQKVVQFKQQNKVGRNEPCPCGSGKKYKRCCGK